MPRRKSIIAPERLARIKARGGKVSAKLATVRNHKRRFDRRKRMSTAIATVREGRYGFDDEQVNVIRSQVAPGATDAELSLFLMYCQRTGLDPFSRQIYLSERKSKDDRGNWVVKRMPETTIDGFRVCAERSGGYEGQLGPFWCGENGQWSDVWLFTDPPLAAKVGILRRGFREPLWAVAMYDEYCQRKSDGQPNSMWRKMPANQLAKCAESLGLRKAFPRELSGVYSREEMPEEVEPQGSREAQKEALDRELAKFQPKQLEAPTPITPEQLADVEPEPEPSGIAGYEQRETAKTVEAETIVKESAKAAPLRKRGSISFKALESIGTIKKELGRWSGNDAIYYAVLEQAGVAHADEVKNDAAGRTLYKVLAARLNSLKVEKEARQALMVAQDVLGRESFEAVCRPFVAPSDVDGGFIEPALLLPGDDWTELVGALKSAVDARQAKPEVHGIRILRLKDLRDQAGGDAFWKVLGVHACDTLELAAQSAEYDGIVQGLVSAINAKERA